MRKYIDGTPLEIGDMAVVVDLTREAHCFKMHETIKVTAIYSMDDYVNTSKGYVLPAKQLIREDMFEAHRLEYTRMRVIKD